MKFSAKKLTIGLMLAAALLGCEDKISAKEQKFSYKEKETVTIANWNLDKFGVKKAKNKQLMNLYADIIKKYDIIGLEEIRDKTGTSIEKLAGLLPDYNYAESTKAGRSNSKEQYVLFYKKGKVSIKNFKDFNPDNLNRWERPPAEAEFAVKNNYKEYNITIYIIHTKPSDVKNELSNLENLINVNEKDINRNIAAIGDMNVDCNYYKRWDAQEFLDWFWAIKWDTTVSPNTKCTYDQILLNSAASKEFMDAGVFTNNIDKKASDHYPVWVELAARDK